MSAHQNIRRAPIALLLAAILSLVSAAPVQASNDALLKLLKILRDRGSISAEEYDELRQTAEASADVSEAIRATPLPDRPLLVTAALRSAPSQAPPQIDARLQELEGRVARQEKAMAGKWYERIGLRGYTQFRFTEVGAGEGPELEVPADRSVNADETFIIRRGRLVFSGDVSDHLALYAQTDFNASTGAADFSLQMRDLYADITLDKARAFRVRVGQSKVPFGWVNMQSSQNRAAMERPDGINSAAEGERDIGAYLLWAPPVARERYREIASQGLKGTGDYGVVAVGAYAGQGPNRADQNGRPHVVARANYPFKLASGQFFELGAQAYRGHFVTPTQPILDNGVPVTPERAEDGVVDQRVGLTAVWYPQPIGVEGEWNVGNGPELSSDFRSITSRSLTGGYVQVNYRHASALATFFPFVRWNYFDGGRKFARNAPRMHVNEVDIGLELAKWVEVELTMMYTRTFERTRTSLFPYASTTNANRVGFQVQWNY